MSSLFPDLVTHRPDHARPGREALDRYYTPLAVAESLTPHVPVPAGGPFTLLEPSVGAGAWLLAGRKAWGDRMRASAIDLDPTADGLRLVDETRSSVGSFLDQCPRDADGPPFDVVLGNPPYRDAEAHVRHALRFGTVVAFLLRLAFLEGQGRRALWNEHPAAKVVVLPKRPSFTGGGTDSAAYALFVWNARDQGPCRLVHA